MLYAPNVTAKSIDQFQRSNYTAATNSLPPGIEKPASSERLPALARALLVAQGDAGLGIAAKSSALEGRPAVMPPPLSRQLM